MTEPTALLIAAGVLATQFVLIETFPEQTRRILESRVLRPWTKAWNLISWHLLKRWMRGRGQL